MNIPASVPLDQVRYILILMYHTLLESDGAAAKAVSWQGFNWVVSHCLPSSNYSRNFLFFHGAGDSSPTLHEGHREVFNVHQLMPADGTPSLTPIIVQLASCWLSG